MTMGRLSFGVLACLMSLAAGAQAQEGPIFASSLGVGASACMIRSGSGSPNGVVTDNVCAVYIQSDTGAIWRKSSGTGNTGWESVGTVTSVALTMPSQFVSPVSGSPITTSGTLAVAWNTQTANYALWGPTSGSAAAPTFRAMVLADLVTDTAGKVLVSGTAASYSAEPRVTAVRGDPTNHALTVGGSTTGGGCVTNPPSTANCEALTYTFPGAYIEQQLKTDIAHRTRWYPTSDGARLMTWDGSGYAKLRVDAAPLQVGSGGFYVGADSIVDPGAGNSILDGYVGSQGFVSQTTGWRIDGSGGADFRYLYTDELIAKSFIADLEQALAGGQIITKSVAMLGAAFTVPAAGNAATLVVKDLPSAPDMAVFETGDYIRVRSFTRPSGAATALIIADAWGTVTGYADQVDGTQTWTFTRLASNAGAATAGTVLPVDAIVLDYGVSGNGYLESTAIDGTIQVTSITRSSSTATVTTTYPHGFLTGDSVLVSGADQTEYNGAQTITVTSSTAFTYTVSGTPTTPATGAILLNGTNGTNAPYQQIVTWAGSSPYPGNQTVRQRCGNLRGITAVAGEYGCLFGTYATSNGQYIRASTQGLELHGLDMALWNGSTRVYRIDHTAPYVSIGNPAPTSFASGTGGWEGIDSGSFKWRVGNPSGNYFSYDVSTGHATVVGEITITGGSGYANLSDKPTLGTLAALNSVAWASNITGIPGTLASPSGTGLFLSSTFMGYYTGGAFKTYIKSDGTFHFGGAGNNEINWDGSTLALDAKNIYAGQNGSTNGQLLLWSGSTAVLGVSPVPTAGVYMSSDVLHLFNGYSSGTEPIAIDGGLFASGYVRAAGSIRSGTNGSVDGAIGVWSSGDTILGGSPAPQAGLYMSSSVLHVFNAYSGATVQFDTPLLAPTATISSGTDGLFQVNYSGGLGTNTQILFTRSNVTQGSITSTGGTTAYNTSSDARLKTDIRPTAFGLEDLLRIEVKDFAFVADPTRATHTGFVAQQLAGVFAEPVYAPSDGGYLQVDYGRLTPLLVKAVQELTARVAALEQERRK
jgi:hypothetical protein